MFTHTVNVYFRDLADLADFKYTVCWKTVSNELAIFIPLLGKLKNRYRCT